MWALITGQGLLTSLKLIEAIFHIPEDVMKALKMKAVQENKRFSKVAEDALRQYLRLPKETIGIEKIRCIMVKGISFRTSLGTSS